MKLSVVIPAKDEESCIEDVLDHVARTLKSHRVRFEIIVVDDGSSDGTAQKVLSAGETFPEIRLVANGGQHGFGLAVRAGLTECSGDAIAVMMADGSDDPQDLVSYWEKLQEGFDCVFGSRFIRGGTVTGYPPHKLVINRLANWFVKVLFGLPYNDVTNAFKCYRRHTVDGIQPLISKHFNLTVEMPIKAIVRGYSYAVVPIRWRNRATGLSKLRIKEMGSRYLFVVLYLWLEKHLSRGDYHRNQLPISRFEDTELNV